MSDNPLGGPIETPVSGDVRTGLPALITNLIRLASIVGGLLVLFNFIIGAYDFLTAGGDPKKMEAGWSKIWQSLIGLVIIVAAIALIGIVELVIFQEPGFILQPTFKGPGSLPAP